MLIDRFISLSEEKRYISKNAAFKGIPEICRNYITQYLKEDGEIKEVDFVIGISEEIKEELSTVFGEKYCDNSDGYILKFNEKITVYAESERGLFYGVMSLCDKCANGFGKGVVYSYPSVDFRMIKLYLPSEENFDFFKKLIDLCLNYGYNTVMLEVGGAMEYESHPEINEGWIEYSKIASAHINKRGDNPYFPYKDENTYFLKNSIHCENADGGVLSKEKVKELVKYCKERFMEVIPEMPSLSHSDYLLTRHPELAERNDDIYPDCYCPSNPETYKLLFDLLKEVIEVFEPQRLNIGHDEAYSIGLCEKCRDKDPAKIFADDIIKIHNFLSENGVKTMMWSDKLINCIDKTGFAWAGARREIKNPKTGELAQIILPTYTSVDMIPDDIEIVHWYWSLEEYTEKDFMKKGFRTVFGNFEPLRVKNIVERLHSGIEGLGISNWSKVDELHIHRNGIYYDVAHTAFIMWSNSYDESCFDRNVKHVADDLYAFRLRNFRCKAEILHSFTKDIPFVLFLDGYEVDKEQNIIGEYVVTYEDGGMEKIPAEYGKTIGYMGVNRRYADSDWCESYETDRRLIEPAYSCTFEFDGEDKTYYRFAVVSDKKIEKMTLALKDEYAHCVEIKEIVIS